MKTAKFIQVSILLLFLLSSNSVTGETQNYYTSYDENNGELCYGIHVGDKLYYEKFAGGQELYENGTVSSSFGIFDQTSSELIEITRVPEGPLDPREANNFLFNRTFIGESLVPWQGIGAFRDMRHEYAYAVFLDWNAWKNMYNNITKEDVDFRSLRNNNYYTYWSPTQGEEVFTLFSLYTASAFRSYSGIRTYDKSDGTLISKYSVQNYSYNSSDPQGRISGSHWVKTHLISKEKVSDEIVCPEVISFSTSKNDDSPIFNYVYLLILVPIIRSRVINNIRPNKLEAN